MAIAKLDNLDLKILKMLSLNARKPYLEISRACNVSGAAIHQRIQKLYNIGVINGSMTLINPEMVGYDTCAFVGLYVSDPSKFNDVIEGLKSIPEVVECYYTTGKYDIFIKLYAHNNEHMLTSILDKFLKMGVARSETLISFKELFKRQIPVCDEDVLIEEENAAEQ
ncbi:MAG: Lrp/AsnC ligand binding domain-containing protein [Muribaculaceae bacterium]|nr:Lrp/AsnC ligand binding domain-containing protein [Muribaculaceae bacterium]